MMVSSGIPLSANPMSSARSQQRVLARAWCSSEFFVSCLLSLFFSSTAKFCLRLLTRSAEPQKVNEPPKGEAPISEIRHRLFHLYTNGRMKDIFLLALSPSMTLSRLYRRDVDASR